MADLQFVLVKAGDGREVSIYDGLVAGRMEDSGLVLTEGHPSRRHARFSVSESEAKVEDLGSANGTFVNDQKISGAVILRPGDKVRFDVEEYVYKVVGDTTEVRGGQETVVRKLEPVDVEIDGSDMRDRPAWIDPESQSDRGPKTEFIDAAAMKEMMQDSEQQGAAEVDGDVDAPMLLVNSGMKQGQRFNLKASGGAGEWTIGCDADRDIVLPDQGVSGIHSKLSQDGMRWKLTDQMSANGTFVNGKRSNMSYLSNGDRVRIGPVECVFRTPESLGTATMVSKEPESSGSLRNILLAVIAFIVTLVVIFAVLRGF